MHTEDKRNQFIELRALGLSYAKIAEQLGVTSRTLVEWGKQYAVDIEVLRIAEREAIGERLAGNREEWIKRKYAHFERLDADFARREFKYCSTESVFRMLVNQRESLENDLFPESPPPNDKSGPAEAKGEKESE